MYWPKPKITYGESTSYVYDTPGTYMVSGSPTKKFGGKIIKGEKKITQTTNLKHWPIYLLIVTNKTEQFGVGVCGNGHTFAHKIYVQAAGKYWHLLLIYVAYGWSKKWWKPWSYVTVKKGGPPKI